MKEPFCCKSKEEENSCRELRRNTVAECQSKNRVAVVKAKEKLLISEQKSNCCSQRRNLTSNLNQLGAVGLGGLNE